MRILRVAQTLHPDVTGGGAYHVHALSRDQAAMGHEVTVLTVRQPSDGRGTGSDQFEGQPERSGAGAGRSGNEPDRSEQSVAESSRPHVESRDGYTVVRFNTTARLLGNALSVGLARYLHAANEFDVVHAHSHLYASTNLAALERRRSATPLAITNHGLYSQTAPASIFEAYLQTAGRWTFEQADLVFCYTDVDERRLRDLGVTTPVAVVPNGVDTERFRPDGPESERLDAAGPTVLFVGRLVEGKRPQDAIAGMEEIRKSVPTATLAVCGDGPLREELEDDPAVADSSDSDSAVAVLGHVDYDEMPAVYRAADVLVLPSRAEGMPRTVLEARASGIPVVTTDLDHVAALDDPGVHTVPVEDVDALAAAVIESLELDTDGAGRATPAAAVSTTDAVSDGGSVTDQLAARQSSGADRASRPAGAASRENLDWRSTVRRTTRALETLAERHSSS
ncbi:glycosyltransferase family 4 protein [Salinarchaeum laminariae]|uniref:glycosyltransferase family 4 protein n=1 Tax=Salinarchaeum laminariae TaxID=869888 RepID=UPI0020C17325|nr:glycosyltransferase family 4 protein [Salinarchaeum laminariae]